MALAEPRSVSREILVHLNDGLLSAFSGAAAGLVSSAVTCPLDVVKTRLQAQIIAIPGQLPYYQGTFGTLATIYRDEGLRGCYRGLAPTILGYLPTWAIYFTLYDKIKSKAKLHSSKGDDEWTVHILAAMVAGATGTTVTNPLWVIKTRLMTQNARTDYHYRNTLDAFKTIFQQEGIRGFYKGLGSSLLGVTHVAVQFPLYEKFKVMMHPPSSSSGSSSDASVAPSTILAASALSKMIASATTYPHEVIRTRLQNQVRRPALTMQNNAARSTPARRAGETLERQGNGNGTNGRISYNGIVHAARVIAHEEGLSGFYHGIVTNMIRTVPASALTILTYELLNRTLLRAKYGGGE